MRPVLALLLTSRVGMYSACPNRHENPPNIPPLLIFGPGLPKHLRKARVPEDLGSLLLSRTVRSKTSGNSDLCDCPAHDNLSLEFARHLTTAIHCFTGYATTLPPIRYTAQAIRCQNSTLILELIRASLKKHAAFRALSHRSSTQNGGNRSRTPQHSTSSLHQPGRPDRFDRTAFSLTINFP